MRASLSIVGLLVVLAIIALSVRNQLHALRQAAPGSTSASASAPFGGTSSPSVAQFQQELDRTMRDAGARAASAGAEADSTR